MWTQRRTRRQILSARSRAILRGVVSKLTEDEWVAIVRRSPRCYYCSIPFSAALRPVLEHVIPLCRSGPNEAANVVAACAACNLRKSPLDRLATRNGSRGATRLDRLHILLTEDERAALDAASERESESVSTLVRRAIREWLLRDEGRRRGIIPTRKRG